MVNEIPYLLEVRGITFGYGHQPLFYDVYLQVRAGEMVGLLGPNGAGKTTLLRLLSGVLSPQQGQVLLGGHDLRQWGRRGAARLIAVVPQELHVPFAFTVEHMVSLGRTPFISLFGLQTNHDQAIIQQGIVADASPTEVLEPRLLRRVYGVNVQVGILRGAQHLSVLPPGSDETDEEHGPSQQALVLVMAGGGSGELLMRALADAHVP